MTPTKLFGETNSPLASGHVTPPAFQGILFGIVLSAAIWVGMAITIF